MSLFPGPGSSQGRSNVKDSTRLPWGQTTETTDEWGVRGDYDSGGDSATPVSSLTTTHFDPLTSSGPTPVLPTRTSRVKVGPRV